MNVYSCWYQGIFGYGCRTRGRKWMFVPELGQPCNGVYKNLCLEDLVFKNPFDKKFELGFDNKTRGFSLTGFLSGLFIPRKKPNTVGGLLFSAY